MDGSDSYAFAGFRFSARRKELIRAGSSIPLGSRAADVLAILLRHAGQTVSKETLMAAVWPDRVVEENNLTVQLSALRRALGETAGGERFIHTEAGRGYRFVAPVTDAEAPSAGPAPVPDWTPARKPSIAALPFDSMSSDPDHVHFADGMVEDIITELSRYPALFVIARNSSFSYRGQARDMRQIGTELGVRYLLEGSVRRGGSRVRVNTQLIDAETGGHIWAERYDRDIGDMFSVQDEITRAVAMAIEPAVHAAEQVRASRVPPANLGAWEAFHRGMWFLEQMDPASNDQARAFFERAIELDPRFASAHAWLVQVWVNQRHVFFNHGGQDVAALAKAEAYRAVALDPNDAATHAALSWAFYMNGDPVSGVASGEHALSLNPNHVEAHRALAQNLVWLGRIEQSRDTLLSCLLLCPRGSRNWMTLHQLTAIHYLAGDYQAAAEAGLRVMAVRPKAVAHRWLIGALGRLGRIDEAKMAMEAARGILGMSFDEYARLKAPSVPDQFHEHLKEGLRLAGWRG
ncbi:MAG TPA: winged helix-turn-helix domain-containing protein [Acetobacteraceae bacterium]|jgi:TolB-like protein